VTEELEHEVVERVAAGLRGANRVLFITGAGISADSGLPTYRGVGGIYGDAPTEDGMTIEEALGGHMLRTQPAVCWKYIRQIEEACRGAQPSAGHRAIAGFEQHVDEVWVLTQNVDGLHRAVGSSLVIDIHGDIHDLQCTQCDYGVEVLDYAALEPVPSCPECGALLRPGVVLFGEMLPYAKLQSLQQELMRGFDVVFSVGTSAVFPYIAEPIVVARREGKLTVEIDPGRTQVSGIVEVKFQTRASVALPAILDAL
jgi:NAD-dependent deacetylase